MTSLNVEQLLVLRNHLKEALAAIDAQLSEHEDVAQLDSDIANLMLIPDINRRSSYYLFSVIQQKLGVPFPAIRSSLERQGYIRHRTNKGIMWLLPD